MASKRRSFRERGRSIGRSLATGMKGTVMAGGTGAGVYFLHDLAQRKVEFLGNRPWVAPAALLVVGHMMKQRAKLNVPGIAVCGAAGYALGNAISFMMKTSDAAKAADTKGLVDQTDDTQGVVDTREFTEGGAFDDLSQDYEQPAFSEARALGI